MTTLPALAQSKTASGHAGESVKHSAAAPHELLLAGGHSLAGSVRLVSGVVAVPVWMSGAVATGSGVISTDIGGSLKQSGKATRKAANTMWDAATGDPAPRPALDHNIGLPRLEKSALRPRDLSPAEAIKRIHQ